MQRSISKIAPTAPRTRECACTEAALRLGDVVCPAHAGMSLSDEEL